MSNQQPRANTRTRKFYGRQILGALLGVYTGYLWYLLIKLAVRAFFNP